MTLPTDRFALIVASSEYEDERLRRLRAPAADAHSLSEVLHAPDIGGYRLESLINQPAYAVSERIEGFFKDRLPDHQLLLYFSCHGVKNDRGRLYFTAPNTKLTRLASTGISSDFVAEQLYECRARRIILILDCCYSGAFTRGMMRRAGEEVTVDNLIGKGRAILVASSAMEYAFEIDGTDIEGEGITSVFTRAIVHGLTTGEADRDDDGLVSVDDLYDHVLNNVHQLTPNQTPGKFVDTYGMIVVARSVMNKFGFGLLSPEMRSALSSPLVGVRKGTVEELEPLLNDDNQDVRRAARTALLQLSNDESARVATAASAALIGSPPISETKDSFVGSEPLQSEHAVPAGSDEPTSEPVPGQGATPVMMARWIEKAQFSTTRLRPGYDEGDVDKLLDAVRDTFLGTREPPLTPEDVRNAQFTTTRLKPGYDEEDVDKFLDEVELRLAAWPAASDEAD
jgi:DivIVA domain-containing protein